MINYLKSCSFCFCAHIAQFQLLLQLLLEGFRLDSRAILKISALLLGQTQVKVSYLQVTPCKRLDRIITAEMAVSQASGTVRLGNGYKHI